MHLAGDRGDAEAWPAAAGAKLSHVIIDSKAALLTDSRAVLAETGEPEAPLCVIEHSAGVYATVSSGPSARTSH